MPSTNKTPNYGLNQWAGNDRPVRADFNKDNEIIDDAMKANSDQYALLLQYLSKGWIPANEVWTYVSSTQFTVPGDQRDKYEKGVKLKWTQNGTARQSNVIADSTYDAGTNKTTVTKHAGFIATAGDCDILNTSTYPITNNYYSLCNPPDFIDWFNWSTSYTPSGSMTFTGISTIYAKFRVACKCIYPRLYVSGTVGGTPNNMVTVNAPVASVQTTGVLYCNTNQGLTVTGCAFLNSDPALCMRKADASDFSSGNLTLMLGGFYEY